MRRTLWILLAVVIIFAIAAVAINIISRPDTASSPSPIAPASSSVQESGTPPSEEISTETTAPTPPPTAPSAPQAELSSAMVVIQNFAFNPPTLRIQKGGSVTWTNRDSVIHNAILNDGSGSTPLLSVGQSATLRFENTGSFSYRCGPHPWMIGTVVVE